MSADTSVLPSDRKIGCERRRCLPSVEDPPAEESLLYQELAEMGQYELLGGVCTLSMRCARVQKHTHRPETGLLYVNLIAPRCNHLQVGKFAESSVT